MINRDNLVVNKTYWFYHFDISKKGTRILNYFKPTQTTVVNKTVHDIRSGGGWSFDFKFDDFNDLSEHMQRNIYHFMNFYSARFFASEEDCKKHHDERIIYWASSLKLNTNDQKLMYKRLCGPLPDKPQVEVDAVSWMENLPLNERKHVKWLIDNYRGKINLKKI